MVFRQTTSLRIQKPEVLEDGADPEDVVVGADHPQGAVRLEGAPRRRQPGLGEAVVGGEVVEPVPVVVDAVDPAVVGPQQLALELQVVGRIGEDGIDAGLGQAGHDLDAVAGDDAVRRMFRSGFNHAAQHGQARTLRQ